MLVTVLGKQVVSYTKKGTDELKEGISLFYAAPKKGVIGQCTDSIWIAKGSELYDKWKAYDLAFPVEAEVVQEFYPGSRYPTLVDVKFFVDATA